jgi:cytidine deaminase
MMAETKPEDQALLQAAREAARRAYCPYSRFPVGAAVQTEIGVITGCNVENASYGLACCAERVALFAAVACGARRFAQLAVACIAAEPTASAGSRMPCGACRQVIAELMQPEAHVLIDGVGTWRVEDLLPLAFELDRRPFLDSPAVSGPEPSI